MLGTHDINKSSFFVMKDYNHIRQLRFFEATEGFGINREKFVMKTLEVLPLILTIQRFHSFGNEYLNAKGALRILA